MSLRVFRKTLVSADIAVNVDQVLADAPIPQDSSQNNVWGELHVVGAEADPVATSKALIYGAEGWLIPITNENPVDIDVIWDSFVPKDTDVASAVFDFDTAAANASNFLDIGEINLERLIGMSAMPRDAQWYSRMKMLSFANSPRGFAPGTPDTYVPADTLKIRSSTRKNAEMPSMSLMGVAVAQLTDVDTTRASPAGEDEWMYLQYAEMALEQAFVFLVGTIEAGAESPWEDAATRIQDFVEPEYLEHGAVAEIEHHDMHAFCQMTFDITVPGMKQFNTVSGGR